MSEEEINRIIAGFMGGVLEKGCYQIGMGFINNGPFEYYNFGEDERVGVHDLNYTQSLDAMIPVWEKLINEFGINTPRLNIGSSSSKTNLTTIEKQTGFYPNEESSRCWRSNEGSIHLTAATATAKAIIELSK